MQNLIEARIYIGCHASYNEGMLLDKCYSITCIDEIDEACKDFEQYVLNTVRKNKSKEEIKMYYPDSYAEELYIADVELYIEGEFVKHDSESIYDLKNKIEVLENFDTNGFPLALCQQIADNFGCDLENLELDDYFIFEVDSSSDYDIGYAYADSTGLFSAYENVPEVLVNYFDYESYGRDLFATCFEANSTTYALVR